MGTFVHLSTDRYTVSLGRAALACVTQVCHGRPSRRPSCVLIVTRRARLCDTGRARPLVVAHPPTLFLSVWRGGSFLVCHPLLSGVFLRLCEHKTASRLPYCYTVLKYDSGT